MQDAMSGVHSRSKGRKINPWPDNAVTVTRNLNTTTFFYRTSSYSAQCPNAYFIQVSAPSPVYAVPDIQL